MNLQDLPEAKPTLEELKSDLENFIEEFSIKRFEAEDIVELLEDGEEVSWIVEQLQHDNANLDSDRLEKILSGIHEYVAPEEEPEEIEEAEEIPVDLDESEEQAIAQAIEASEIDFSKLDIKDLAPALEEITGEKLTDPAMLKQIESMMQGEQGKLMTDFALWCQEQGIDMTAVNDPDKINELNQQWMQTPRPAFDGKTPAEISGSAGLPGFKKVETYHRDAPKIGRNDPCPCGSGKKYKKCCGRNL
jgi:uncharacterized protein YecA (UPF0149 family)